MITAWASTVALVGRQLVRRWIVARNSTSVDVAPDDLGPEALGLLLEHAIISGPVTPSGKPG
jgi:hypothetical protein